ncbi:nucleotidyltransferase domain-containing protein [Desulfonatronospira sp. MSAO_Bac3]|uniref:type VII toxin-antitoxin system MntA family adenylyltransferase antitoxin n=1 Tax=Desulfonatronospira sp. MSAO_Bac3 TaxID=2293857 RepID=UPI000FF48752|nr:nucleotidyltransferase domain-containing protein [Desulfonatronospira sp. MSAO_Bac3]RQD79533.1 MAG: nucleotidyltransferase domain-containing protein [Desulfonatronospira sp. MSAO_Bac3]
MKNSLDNKNLIYQALSGYPFVQAAYLFGSRARGGARHKSDMDLALVCSKTVSGWERLDMETHISNLLGVDVDLVIFHQAGILLQHQILKHGQLVYEINRRERIRQETRARYDYPDTRHLHKKLGDVIHG